MPLLDSSSELESVLYNVLVQTTRSCTFRLSTSGNIDLLLAVPNGERVPLGEVANAEGCGDTPLGWYRDPGDPTLARLCSDACDRANEPGVGVVAGCRNT
jgi:hypothetical protein